VHNKLIIRADASPSIGTGHIMRMLALAQAWHRTANGNPQNAGGHSVLFVSALLPEALEKRLNEEGFLVHRIDAAPGSQKDVDQTLRTIQSAKTHALAGNLAARAESSFDDWLVIDGYSFDTYYQQMIRRAGYKLAVVDDYKHLSAYDCDILINQNIGAEKILYPVNDNARQLLGLQFALIRREFLRLSVTPNASRENPGTGAVRDKPFTVLVTMGGGDLHGMTEHVLNALSRYDNELLQINIVVGAASSSYDRIKQSARKCRHQTAILNNVKDMRELMLGADLAVSAAGSTCWELLLNGVPLMVLVLADNQVAVAREMDSRGVAKNLGWYSGWSEDAFLSAFDLLLHDYRGRQRMSSEGRALVDGKGGDRVVAAMKDCQ